MAERAALLRLPWRVRLRGLNCKSGVRPAAQGRAWRPERLLPCGNAAREPGQERCATSCARSLIGAPSNCCPNGIAARVPGQERCDQLRKVAKWRPERLLPYGIAARVPGQERCATSCARSLIGAPSDCCPNGIAARVPGKKGQLLRNAAEAPERLLPYGIAARVPGQRSGSCCQDRPRIEKSFID